MDQFGISQKVNRGYGIAARFLGVPFQQYRPLDPLAPLANPLGNLQADFDVAPGFTYAAPAKFANPIYYGLFDATGVIVADILIGPTGTWFVAGMEPNKPVLCVRSNRVVDVRRPSDSIGDRKFYGGDVRTEETDIAVGVPVSQLQGTKGERGSAGLPGDARVSWAALLMPLLPNFAPQPFDRIYDDLGNAWTLSSIELTNLGWRMTTVLADT